MRRVKPTRQQHGQRLADHLDGLVAEHPDGAVIEEADGLGFIHADDRIRGDVQDAGEDLIGNGGDGHGREQYFPEARKVSGIA
jgi:hypothetical protein